MQRKFPHKEPLTFCSSRSTNICPTLTVPYCNYQTTTTTTTSSITVVSSGDSQSSLPPRRNLALEAIKEAGWKQLDETAQKVAKKSHKSLLLTGAEEKAKPNVRQLRLASNLLDIIEDVMEGYCSQVSELCSAFGEPVLEVTDVEVSPDLGYARVYWTLPVTMEDKPLAQVRYVTQHIQRLMEEKHGRHIQHLVAGRLRKYRYVPKLRFVPELTELTHSDIVLKARRQLR